MEFRLRLTELLAVKGMKQADLCRITGISTSLISQYSTGRATPLLDKAQAIAKALGVSLDELVSEQRESKAVNPIECTEDETEIICRYRSLDERGRHTVRKVLDAECQYIHQQS